MGKHDNLPRCGHHLLYKNGEHYVDNSHVSYRDWSNISGATTSGIASYWERCSDPPKPPRPMTPEERDQLLGCLVAPFVILWFGARALDQQAEERRKEHEEYLRRTARLQTFLAHSRTGTVFSASETERMAYLYLFALYHVTDYKMKDLTNTDVERRLRQVVEWPKEASHRSKRWLVRHLRVFRKVSTKRWVIDWSAIYPPIPELPDDPAAAGEAVKQFIWQLSQTPKRR